jgi:hypothetical protein
MTQKRHCHSRESGHPEGPRAAALDSRFRGNDTTSKDLILNDAPNGVLAGLLHMPAVLGKTTKTMDLSGVFHSGAG